MEACIQDYVWRLLPKHEIARRRLSTVLYSVLWSMVADVVCILVSWQDFTFWDCLILTIKQNILWNSSLFSFLSVYGDLAGSYLDQIMRQIWATEYTKKDWHNGRHIRDTTVLLDEFSTIYKERKTRRRARSLYRSSMLKMPGSSPQLCLWNSGVGMTEQS